MVNFGPRDTVPERYRSRRFVEHNPQVTLMRTTAEENARMGEWIARKVNEMTGPVRFLIPEGASPPSTPPASPSTTRRRTAPSSTPSRAPSRRGANRRLVRTPHHVNDAAFADAVAGALASVHPPTIPSGRTTRHAALERSELVARFQDMKRRGEPIVGGGAGTGLSAKCEEAGGIDLIVIYNSGRYRMAGPRLARRG